MDDGIFALATAPGRAAVAMMRLSGMGVRQALVVLTGESVFKPRKARFHVLYRPNDRVVIDQALTLWFPGPHSYTGEDCVELHLHGGLAVIDAVTQALIDLGLRLAEPGEFTRRAFENGKLDLSQAEAVADLIDATTDAQRGQALAQLNGELARRYAVWRDLLVKALAILEAAVDFPDEDVPLAIADTVVPIIVQVEDELARGLADGGRGECIREGFRIAIIGPPNAGKSSLLNALVGRAAAIVTTVPGTTRDVIETSLNLAGYRVLVADTAGLRSTDNLIEIEGIRRAREWARSAELRLLVVDGSSDDVVWREASTLIEPNDLCLLNKNDLPLGVVDKEARDWAQAAGLEIFSVNLVSGNIDVLLDVLKNKVINALSGAEFPVATRIRHRRDISAAHAHLMRARVAFKSGAEIELIAEDIRLAARSLARISGKIGSEEILDRVFASFCIGK